jgi:sn-glycerol 3-phosphate transport system substrate-binding protein
MPAANETTLKALTDQYNASQSKVRVKLAYQGTYDQTADKYIAALRGGGSDLPDLVQLEETRIQLMIDSKSVLAAQACVDAAGYDLSDHLPVVLDEFRVDGRLWPMPFNVSNPVLYFDTNDFRKAGLDPTKPPRTFDELRAAAKAIKDSGAAKTGFALELSPWYVEQWFAEASEPIVDHGNGRTGRTEKVAFANATGRDIFTFLQKLVDDGLAVSVGRNPSGADHLLALGTGGASMTIGTSAALGSIYAIQAAGQFADVGVGVAPLPGPTSATGGVLVGGGALWLVDKGKSDPQKAAAWDYAKWLNEPTQQAVWHAGTGYLPIRKSAVTRPEVAKLWAEKPTYRVAFDQLSASKAKQGGPVVGPYAEFRAAIVGALERLVIQHQAPDAALTQAAKEADTAIKDYNDRVGS